MGRRNESPEKKRRRALIGEFLKENPIKDANDINELVKELIAQVVENSLEGELDDELGYTKYDYKNKETDNSRNGYSQKRFIQVLVIWNLIFQEIEKVNLSPN